MTQEERQKLKHTQEVALYQLFCSYDSLSKEKVMELLPNLFPKADDTKYFNCPDFYETIERINANNEYDYIIVKKGVRKFGFGTREEITEMVKTFKERSKHLAIKANQIIAKSRLDGVSYLVIEDNAFTGVIAEKETIIK